MSSENLILAIYRNPQTVFSIQALNMLFPQYDRIRLLQSLNYYKRRGEILNPRGGIYAKENYKKEEMACALFWPAHISLDYVLAKSGVIYQYGTKVTCVSYLNREVEIDGITYSYHRMKPSALGCDNGIQLEGASAIASPERALVDSLYLFPDYQHFDNLDVLDKDKVLEIATELNNKSLVERVKQIFSYGQ